MLLRLIPILVCLIPLGIRSQNTDSALVANFILPEIRPLEELIDDALKFSPLLKAQALSVDNISHKINLLDKEWSNYLAGVGTFQVGNIRYIDNVATGGVTDPQTISRENTFYSFGVHARLPLGDFLTKNDRKAILENQLEQEKLFFQDRELQIRELVIRQYQELELAIRILAVKQKDLDFLEVSVQWAEKQFTESNISLEAYTVAVTRRNTAEQSLEEAKTRAELAWQLLRELVGTDIN